MQTDKFQHAGNKKLYNSQSEKFNVLIQQQQFPGSHRPVHKRPTWVQVKVKGQAQLEPAISRVLEGPRKFGDGSKYYHATLNNRRNRIVLAAPQHNKFTDGFSPHGLFAREAIRIQKCTNQVYSSNYRLAKNETPPQRARLDVLGSFTHTQW